MPGTFSRSSSFPRPGPVPGEFPLDHDENGEPLLPIARRAATMPEPAQGRPTSALQYLRNSGQNSATRLHRLLTGSVAQVTQMLPDLTPAMLQRTLVANGPLVTALIMAIARRQNLIPDQPSPFEAQILNQLSTMHMTPPTWLSNAIDALVARLSGTTTPAHAALEPPSTPPPPLDVTVQRWFPEKAQRWGQFASEEHEADYARYLHVLINRLNTIIASGEESTRPDKAALYRGLVKDVLDPIEGDSELRAKCFKVANARMTNCVDNQLIGLHEQDNIIEDWALKKLDLPLDQLHDKLIPLTRKNKLYEETFNLAVEKGNKDESLEYMLRALQTKAIAKIIPPRNYGAVHTTGFDVDENEARIMANRILNREKEIGIVDDLLMFESWKSALRKHYPQAYLREKIPAELTVQSKDIDKKIGEKSELLEKLLFPAEADDTVSTAGDGKKNQEQTALGKEIKDLVFIRDNIENNFWHNVNREITCAVLQAKE